jgi:WD40 repeat protein
VSAGGDDSIILWDLAAPHRLASAFPGYEGPTQGVVISSDGALVSAGICVEFDEASSAGRRCHQSGIRIWDRVTRKELRTWRTGRRAPPTSMVFAAEANSLVSSTCAEGDRGERCHGIVVERWDLRTGGVEQHRIDDDHPSLDSLVLNPDGTIVAAGACKSAGGTSTDCSIGEIRLFDTRTQRQIGTPLVTPGGGVHELAFSPDGQTLVASSGGDIISWSISTRKPLGRPEPGSSVSFTRDSKLVAVAVPPVSDPHGSSR